MGGIIDLAFPNDLCRTLHQVPICAPLPKLTQTNSNITSSSTTLHHNQRSLGFPLVLGLILGLLGIGTGSWEARGQAAQEVFGKSRIQHRTFRWQYLSSTNFDIYYYQDSASMARNVARYAEEEFVRIGDLMGFSPYNKIRIYVYTSRADLLQSNVGLEAENNSIGGRTNFVKSLIEIAYPGSQVKFRKAIAEGVASKLGYDMLYGGSLKDMVQSTYLLLLPDWFLGGAVRYASQGWSRELDNYMRDAFLSGNVRQPSNMLGEKAAIIGQSIWNYIGQRYGRSAISNVLNQTRLQRDEEESIMLSLGVPYQKFIRDWRDWYIEQGQQTAKFTTALSDKDVLDRLGTNRRTHQMRQSPDGKFVAYTINNIGAYSIRLLNLESGNSKTILSGGYRVINQEPDYQTPAIAWQGNDVLHIIRSQNGKLQWINYDVLTSKTDKQSLLGMQQVNSFDVRTDAKGTHLVMSADVNCMTHLMTLSTGKQQPTYLTRDLFDDLDPRWMGDTAIVFSSNRLSDTLRNWTGTPDQISNSFDLWQYNLRAKNKPLVRLTRTWYNETQPMVLANAKGAVAGGIFYLTDESGILGLGLRQRNGNTIALSNWQQDITVTDIRDVSKPFVLIALRDDKLELYRSPALATFSSLTPHTTPRIDQIGLSLRLAARQVTGFNTSQLAQQGPRQSFTEPSFATQQDPGANSGSIPDPKPTKRRFIRRDTIGPQDIDIRNYIFEAERISSPAALANDKALITKKGTKVNQEPSAKDDLINMVKSQQLDDKSLAFGPYQSQNRMNFASVVSSIEINPLAGWGVHLQSNMTDLFEHHKIYGGGTLYGDFVSNILFGEYQYLARHLDLKARYDRKLFSNSTQTYNHRYVLDKVSGTVSYPITIRSSISASPFYATTRYTELVSAGVPTLTKPDVVVPYGGLKLEYVFDNTLSQGLNILQGTRLKANLEHYEGINEKSRSFTNINIDARHYQKIYNEIVLALRASYGSSYGNAPKQFLLGGMDNWINNSTERTGILDETSGGPNGKTDWLFTQYATNMRGFKYNTMSGNSYLLFSAELRIPIIRAFYRGPISSNFMRHLQLTGFTDMGSAWTGGNPFTTDNSINTRAFRDGPFNITVINYDNPFLIGYGVGARTIFLGYYLKLDVAQGLRNNTTTPLTYYLTLGYDF